jgi:hypothetical protein
VRNLLLCCIAILACQTAQTTTSSATTEEASSPHKTRVLFIGNSQLGFDPPDVVGATQELLGNKWHLDRIQTMGVGCDGFISDETPGGAMNRASSGDYDVVVFIPAIFETLQHSGCWDRFRTATKKAGARFVMMASAHVHAAWPHGFTALETNMQTYARAHQVEVIRAGRVWLNAFSADDVRGQLSLYGGDDQHPGVVGSYLYVLTLVSFLSSVTVLGLPTDVPLLRCPASAIQQQTCADADEVRSHINADGQLTFASPPIGVQWSGNGEVAMISMAEAARMQQLVDDVMTDR